MRRWVVIAVFAVGALAACSSSTDKSGGAGSTVASTAASTTTTTAVQAEQTIPTRTSYVVDGRKVALTCKGHGRIPVVFQAGGREQGFVWNDLIAALGDRVFTCVFDRPGATVDTFLKPPTEMTRPSVVSKQLADTLRQAGVGPRVILVGHSAGGTDAFVFGGSYPDQVAGAVLFDPSVPQYVTAGEWERIGFDRVATASDVRAVTKWPDVPLVILTADSKLVIINKEANAAEERGWIAGHKRWASLSSQGVQREVPNTSHFVYVTAPKVAADAIREVLAKAS